MIKLKSLLLHFNKRPMGHIAHLRKQLKSINTYDYIITLIKRRRKNINFMITYCFFHLYPHPRMLCAKIGWNWLSGSGEEDENVKSLRQQRQRRQTTDKFWSEKLTWAFGSGELKTISYHKVNIFFSSLNQRFDIIICVYWIELFSQVSDVAHGPLVITFSWVFGHVYFKSQMVHAIHF